jgi:DUF305 family protein family protein
MEIKMKKVILLAAGALVLASVTAYAQMHHRGGDAAQPGQGMMCGQMPCPMHDQMQKKMHGMMQGKGGGHHGAGGHDAQSGGGHGAHAAEGPQGDRGPSSLAFHGINQQMHEGMNLTFTGNADVDFVNGMIPHHQGAVDMAKVVLAFGKDPEIRKLAEAIVQAQESEISQMRAWLKRNAQ